MPYGAEPTRSSSTERSTTIDSTVEGMSNSAAIQMWQKKLDFLQAKEAKAVDPAQQFRVVVAPLHD